MEVVKLYFERGGGHTKLSTGSQTQEKEKKNILIEENVYFSTHITIHIIYN